ncbi:olfactory receptor 2D3-like [Microcaecilia unicolor]|uniref:Olfactory receptor n=1 Tax=Microcaecilia unicolor TaxID=1415580 RepID=A0A6P7XA69_9AMPH|nr:olfactory receptor 2D3-like [Microcaecilia unicolor]
MVNETFITEFILIGLSSDPKMALLLFQLFLVLYIVILLGNLMIITVVGLDPQLHTPMYFFLSNLSILDIAYTSTIVPKMLVNLLSIKKTISFNACATQIYMYLLLGETECLLLAVMAYDRYVAICNPLRYTSIMDKAVCLRLAATSWLTGFIISIIDVYFVFRLPYCGPNMIDHFFCEATVVLRLACADISVNEIVTLVGGALVLLVPLSLILTSYAHILAVILRIHSAEGRCKTFSTCASHIAVVTLFYGTAISMYMRPRPKGLTDGKEKMVSVFYTIVTPLLNPLIYSLRNQDVKRAIWKALRAKKY